MSSMIAVHMTNGLSLVGEASGNNAHHEWFVLLNAVVLDCRVSVIEASKNCDTDVDAHAGVIKQIHLSASQITCFLPADAAWKERIGNIMGAEAAKKRVMTDE